MAQQSAARRASLCEQDGPLVDSPAPVSRILLVGDAAGLLRSSATVLRDAGFEVYTCSHPGEVLLRVRERAPDLLLLDLHFDEMHTDEGFDCLRKLGARTQAGSGAESSRVVLLRPGALVMIDEARVLSKAVRGRMSLGNEKGKFHGTS